MALPQAQLRACNDFFNFVKKKINVKINKFRWCTMYGEPDNMDTLQIGGTLPANDACADIDLPSGGCLYDDSCRNLLQFICKYSKKFIL